MGASPKGSLAALGMTHAGPRRDQLGPRSSHTFFARYFLSVLSAGATRFVSR